MQESNAKVMVLTKRVSDLQDAMGLMSNDGSRINSKALGRAVFCGDVSTLKDFSISSAMKKMACTIQNEYTMNISTFFPFLKALHENEITFFFGNETQLNQTPSGKMDMGWIDPIPRGN